MITIIHVVVDNASSKLNSRPQDGITWLSAAHNHAQKKWDARDFMLKYPYPSSYKIK